METLPVVGGTIVGVLVVLSGLVRFFLSDSKAFDVLSTEVRTLRDSLSENDAKIAALEARYDEQRREKHAVINKYASSQILLRVIDKLAEQCACGALSNVRELIDQALAEHSEI